METSIATPVKTTWVLDQSHSELGFKVKHLMITNVNGKFQKFSATVDGEDFTKAPIRVIIDAASVDTNDAGRDGHLKGADFFDTDTHAEIIFESTSLKQLDDESYELIGILEIKGVRNQVRLDVEFGGIGKDPWGNEKAGFSVKGKISRKNWGLNWNSMLESGGVLVSDDVKIHAEVQLIKKSDVQG